MKMPELKIGHLISRLPIIQGGMGVGISMSGLASAVANAGGIGVIAGAMAGINRKGYIDQRHRGQLPGPFAGDPQSQGKDPWDHRC